MNKIIEFSVRFPRGIIWGVWGVTIFFLLIATLPTIFPNSFTLFNKLKIDTDPENMLSESEAVRIFNRDMKKELNLYDILVVGVVNNKHKNGVFNKESLKNIFELTKYAENISWKDDSGKVHGIVKNEIIAPSTSETITQAGLGAISFSWIMSSPPKTEKEALNIRDKALNIPFLKGTLISEDAKAIALYFPLTSKDISHKVSIELKKKINSFKGNDKFHITGLPVAEDTFGFEMFYQMMLSAPLAMLIIFLLMFYFFRSISLITPPLIIALISVIITMGLLISLGYTVHIMSSMIPIFIMPIAVLDAIHVISEFFDKYKESEDRKEIIKEVMRTLFTPMFYTSLTTFAGFFSLALTPIPPVQVFGSFIAIGVIVAWILTITFIPASIILIPEKKLKTISAKNHLENNSNTFLTFLAKLTYRFSKIILIFCSIILLIAIYGIFKIQINDNPTKWFNKNHPIRIADKVLNEHFGGTYMAYLSIKEDDNALPTKESLDNFLKETKLFFSFEKEEFKNSIIPSEVINKTLKLNSELKSFPLIFDALYEFISNKAINSTNEESDKWDMVLEFLDTKKEELETFKNPEVLKYIAQFEKYLLTLNVVGKSNSLPTIVKTVHRELLLGKDEEFRIPNSSSGVAQTLISYQNSHRPNDLWHFVTPNYRTTSLWIQLKSGDNKDMIKVVEASKKYIKENPPPLPLKLKWFGLTYINTVWQDKMVAGMGNALIGSFIMVLIMMIILFRSFLWGLLCMVPLSLTIMFIYGAIGLFGKDYDMPVAVLSALSLGLSVDYAIHFLSRSKELRIKNKSWKNSINEMFKEPVKAISRNIIVVGLGFLPLLLSSLKPYQTVGIFIASILIIAGMASIIVLPSLNNVLEKNFLRTKK